MSTRTWVLILAGLFPNPWGIGTGQEPQAKTPQQVLEAADKALEDGRARYEQGKSRAALSDLTAAAFAVEEARVKYQAVQEFTSGELQARAASQLRVANQLTKLINDARKAAGAPAAPPPSEPKSPRGPAAQPEEPRPQAPESLPSAAARRPAPPAAEQQKAAERQVRDLFKSEYAKKGPGERRELARTLLEQSRRSGSDVAGRWALLREAADLAAQAGDADTAVLAVEEIGTAFEVDLGALKSAALGTAAKAAKSREDLVALAARSREWAEEETELENYATAEKAWIATGAAARKASDAPLASLAAARAKELASVRARHESLKRHWETLARNSADPAANQAVGEFLCFVKERWEAGLSLLAKGNDAALRRIAAKEMSVPAEVEAQIALGDAWWDYAAKAGPEAKEAVRRRAVSWYEATVDRAEGLSQLRIRKRLEEAESSGVGPVNLLRQIDPVRDAVQGKWSVENGELVCQPGDAVRLQIPYVPPDEYDLRIVAERRAGNRGVALGMARGSTQWGAGFDYFPQDGYRSGLLLLDGVEIPKGPHSVSGPVLDAGRRYEFLLQVRKTGVRVAVDGKAMIDWEGPFTRLGLPPNMKLPQPDTLWLASWGNRVHFSRIELTPIGGKGRRIR